ncbi:Fpg/Nei family DNA glycosylase [Actinocatenispora rupis]|uniref:Formamidopyrimidine-DNA glycosylase n=1 Tax=Actinocatenispora rupis TaxID=519421 RepID=A0A8J3J1C2_9ACTN|nr:Fpg/Nei family DNA glycosylase [Actinocatenispora rupis]GID12413.1 formamidopyrimidine-DNA glycosylase [Actinocatenispora rupis]
MPELPDVESFRRLLAERAERRVLRAVDVCDPRVLHGGTPRELSGLVGRRFTAPRRHGKWLVVGFAPVRRPHPALLMHFGMTGALVWVPDDEPPGPYDLADLAVTGGRIRYRDQRRLQGWWWAPGPDEVAAVLDGLGPDAADASARTVAERLTAHRRGVKSALLDQRVLAGLGNLMADEVLWRARLDPARPTTDLSGTQIRTLHRELRRTVRAASRAGRVPDRPGWLTGHRDAPDPHCPRCGAALRRRRVAGRGT